MGHLQVCDSRSRVAQVAAGVGTPGAEPEDSNTKSQPRFLNITQQLTQANG